MHYNISKIPEIINGGLSSAFKAVSSYAHSALDFVHESSDRFFGYVSPKIHEGLHEVKLIEEGALHISEASEDIKLALRRDFTTCAVETGLCVAKDISFETTFAVAALETGEKIINSPGAKLNLVELGSGFVESLVSSAAAASHAAADVICDLQKSGHEWEVKHCKPL